MNKSQLIKTLKEWIEVADDKAREAYRNFEVSTGDKYLTLAEAYQNVIDHLNNPE